MLIVEYLDKPGFEKAINKHGQPDPYTVKHGKDGDAGYDLAAAYNDYQIAPGASVTIACGVKFNIPDGQYMRVVMRSGHGFKQDISCHIGTIDSGYREEVFVRVRNHSKQYHTIKRGERFAQFILQRYESPAVQEGIVLPDTERGLTGMGSTG